MPGAGVGLAERIETFDRGPMHAPLPFSSDGRDKARLAHRIGSGRSRRESRKKMTPAGARVRSAAAKAWSSCRS